MTANCPPAACAASLAVFPCSSAVLYTCKSPVAMFQITSSTLVFSPPPFHPLGGGFPALAGVVSPPVWRDYHTHRASLSPPAPRKLPLGSRSRGGAGSAETRLPQPSRCGAATQRGLCNRVWTR